MANGGFGPAYGLLGAFGGYRDTLIQKRMESHLLQESVVQWPTFKDKTFLDLESYEQHGDPQVIDVKYDVGPTIWSKSFIPLCEWGCGRSAFLHAQNGRVYSQDERYLFRQADSLEEWLDRWLRGEDLEQVDWTELP